MADHRPPRLESSEARRPLARHWLSFLAAGLLVTISLGPMAADSPELSGSQAPGATVISTADASPAYIRSVPSVRAASWSRTSFSRSRGSSHRPRRPWARAAVQASYLAGQLLIVYSILTGRCRVIAPHRHPTRRSTRLPPRRFGAPSTA